jgi:hypothetical protein
MFDNKLIFHGEGLLASFRNPKLQDNLFSAAQNCLFNIPELESNSSIHNLRTCQAAVTRDSPDIYYKTYTCRSNCKTPTSTGTTYPLRSQMRHIDIFQCVATCSMNSTQSILRILTTLRFTVRHLGSSLVF